MNAQRLRVVRWILAGTGAALACAAPMVGCGSEVQVIAAASSTSGGGGHGGATTSSSISTSGGGEGGSFLVTTGTGAAGCNTPGVCGPGMYCDDYDDACFATPGTGTCAKAVWCSGQG